MGQVLRRPPLHQRLPHVAIFALCCLFCASPAGAQATFTPLGDLSGGGFESQANAVSGDGAVVVGQGLRASGYEAFWDAVNGMGALGFPVGPRRERRLGNLERGLDDRALERQHCHRRAGARRVGHRDGHLGSRPSVRRPRLRRRLRRFPVLANDESVTDGELVQYGPASGISTCVLHGVDPYTCLVDVLQRIDTHRQRLIERLSASPRKHASG